MSNINRKTLEEIDNMRNSLIKKVLNICRNDGESMMYAVFDLIKKRIPILKLNDPDIKTIKTCMEYVREKYGFREEHERLLSNQIICDPSKINYVK